MNTSFGLGNVTPFTFLISHEEKSTCQQRFENLQRQYPYILNSAGFIEMTELFEYEVPDVNQDNYLVIPENKKNIGIGTSGLRPCIAVCARGKDVSNHVFLALAHQSFSDPEETLQLLIKKLLGNGCFKESIEIYLIGGVVEENRGCIDSMEKFLALSNIYPIKGARFNILEPVAESVYEDADSDFESISVVLTKSNIFYSKNPDFFIPQEGLESAGDIIELEGQDSIEDIRGFFINLTPMEEQFAESLANWKYSQKMVTESYIDLTPKEKKLAESLIYWKNR